MSATCHWKSLQKDNSKGSFIENVAGNILLSSFTRGDRVEVAVNGAAAGLKIVESARSFIQNSQYSLN